MLITNFDNDMEQKYVVRKKKIDDSSLAYATRKAFMMSYFELITNSKIEKVETLIALWQIAVLKQTVGGYSSGCLL